MQLVTSAPPVLSPEEEAELQEALDREAFIDAHIKEVLRDFKIAQAHAKNGAYRLAVTPSRTIIRRADVSTVRVDLLDGNCREISWLKKLYKDNLPVGASVTFGIDTMLRAACNDHLEDIYILVINFTFVATKKKPRILRRTA